MNYDYDVIVVGSGFGGSVTALRLTEKGYRVGVLEAGRRWDADDFPKTNWNVRKIDLGAAPRAHRPAADQCAGQVPGLQRRRRRRRVAHLRQHALRAAAGVLPRPGLGAHHRLAGRARALLRPGEADARRGREPADRPQGRPAAAGRERSRRRRHLPQDPGRCLLQRGQRGHRGRRSLLRRRRPATGRLHPLLGVLHRLQAQRQEHHHDQLPLPRGAERRRGPSADDRHLGEAQQCLRQGLRGRDRAFQRQAAEGSPYLHRGAGGLRRCRARHPEAAPPAAGRRHPARALAAAGRAHPQQLRGDHRHPEPVPRRLRPGRGDHVVDPSRAADARRGLHLRQGPELALRADRPDGRRRRVPLPAVPADDRPAPAAVPAVARPPPRFRAVGDPAGHAVARQLADVLPEGRAAEDEAGEWRAQPGLAPGRARGGAGVRRQGRRRHRQHRHRHLQHPGHRALHRRLHDRRLPRNRRDRPLPAGLRASRAAHRRRQRDHRQPRRQPVADHHRPGRAGDGVLAQQGRVRRPAGPGCAVRADRAGGAPTSLWSPRPPPVRCGCRRAPETRDDGP